MTNRTHRPTAESHRAFLRQWSAWRDEQLAEVARKRAIMDAVADSPVPSIDEALIRMRGVGLA